MLVMAGKFHAQIVKRLVLILKIVVNHANIVLELVNLNRLIRMVIQKIVPCVRVLV